MKLKTVSGSNMNTQKMEAMTEVPTAADRRQHVRFRLSIPISVSVGAAEGIPAMTLEISEGGLSAVLASPVEIGETVKLYPIARDAVTACVRHRIGRIFGFEFAGITPEQANFLRELCSKLPRYPAKNRIGI